MGNPFLKEARSLSENREPTAEKPFRPDSPIKFVKYAQYSPHLIEKSDSKWLSLATAPILGQAPSRSNLSLLASSHPAPDTPKPYALMVLNRHLFHQCSQTYPWLHWRQVRDGHPQIIYPAPAYRMLLPWSAVPL